MFSDYSRNSSSMTDSSQKFLDSLNPNCDEKDRIDRINDYCEQNVKVDLVETQRLNKEVLQKARALRYNKGIAAAIVNHAWILYYQAQYDLCLKRFQEGEELFRALPNEEKGVLSALIGKGIALTLTNDYQLAANVLREALNHCEELGNAEYQGRVLGNLGFVNSCLERYEIALDYYLRALDIFTLSNLEATVIIVLSNIGETLIHLSKPREALSYLEKAIKMALDSENTTSLSTIYRLLGQANEGIGENQNALELYDKALTVAKETASKRNIDIVSYRIGMLLMRENKLEEAKSRLLSVLDSEESGLHPDVIPVYKVLSELFENEGDSQKALSYLKSYLAIKEKQFDENTLGKIKDVEVDSLREANRRIGIISEISREITFSLDFDEILETVYKHVNSLMDATVFAIGLWDRKKDLILYDFVLENGVILKPFTRKMDNSSFAAWCIRNRKEIILGNVEKNYSFYLSEPPVLFGGEAAAENPRSCLFVPLIIKDKVIGLISTQSYKENAYSTHDVETLKALAGYVAIALNNAQQADHINSQNAALKKNNEELQNEISERKRAQELLKQAQNELIEHAHKAGMTEIASDTLHNIGNVLNSVKTSAFAIKESIDQCPQNDFSKTCRLIRSSSGDFEKLKIGDTEGKKIIEYLTTLEKEFDRTHKDISENIDRLNDKIEMISQVIAAQQNYVGGYLKTEPLNIADMVEDALSLLPNILDKQEIVLIKDMKDTSDIKGEKTKLLHTLVNLIKNSVDATSGLPNERKTISISTSQSDQYVILEITDTGHGIPRENLDKIFTHGFTTKENGFGFGLHSCAVYIQEMGALISAESEGVGKGATFRLQFPVFK